MDGESVMRCYISTGIALTACLRKRLSATWAANNDFVKPKTTVSGTNRQSESNRAGIVSGPVQLPKYRPLAQMTWTLWT